MSTAFNILQEPFPRPEPGQIQALSLDEIVSTVIQSPHFIGAEDKIIKMRETVLPRLKKSNKDLISEQE